MKPKHTLRDQVWPVLLVAFFILLALIGVWTAGSARGADTWGHLFRAEYLAGEMAAQGPGAYFTAAWMPNWYMGDPFLTYYPPLTTLLLAPLIYLTQNSDIALRILISSFLVSFSILTFAYLDRTWNRWAAFLGTVLAVGAPYQMRTVFFEGNLPRMLSLLALPAIALLTDRLLSPHSRRAPLTILLALCWSWAILAHPQQAVIFAIGVSLYLVLRLILDPEVPLYRLAPWLGSILLGALFAAPWLLPAYSRAELANIPFLPAEKIPLFSSTLYSFLPRLDLTHGQILFGFGSLLIGLLAIAARPDPHRSAWYLTGLLAILFSLGPDGVFFNLIPLNNQLLPERFLNFSAFAIPVAAAGLLPMGRNLRLIRSVLLVILVTVELIPAARIIPSGEYPRDQAVLEAVLTPGGGRVALMTYPEPTALEVYFAGKRSPLIFGWALENTPHHVALRRVLSAPEWGPEYLEALFARWDVRTVVIAGGTEADPAREAVSAMGFDREAVIGRYELWRTAAPPAQVQSLPAQNMLLVGDRLAPFLAAFPFAEEASPETFLNEQSGFLTEYPILGFYRFAEDSAEVKMHEDILRNYLNAGGTVVVDLSGMEDIFGGTLDFFGVHAFRLAFDDRMTLRGADSSISLPTQLHFAGLTGEGWSGASYEGLDTIVAVMDRDGTSFPVLGYKTVGLGRVWFVGGNLLYYTQLAGQEALREYIREVILEDIRVSRSLVFPSIPLLSYAESAGGLTFDYFSAAPIPALVSYTYHPRWLATIDGMEVGLGVRDNLIRILLPAGTHHVEIRYDAGGTIWPWLGGSAAILGVFCAAVFWLLDRHWRKHGRPPRDFLEVFQKPESPEGGGTFTPCAHCGFRLAVSHPPTPITYPFQVSHCPICEARMDDEGFLPGKDLTREEQARALHQWLRANHYDPRMIHTQWGFSVEEFFKR
ncbi:MAG: hypothetical protein JW748_04285 [Anaerolineales bacterium]|nr:hypothetical protein [Anaerolineales bacterium]